MPSELQDCLTPIGHARANTLEDDGRVILRIYTAGTTCTDVSMIGVLSMTMTNFVLQWHFVQDSILRA